MDIFHGEIWGKKTLYCVRDAMRPTQNFKASTTLQQPFVDNWTKWVNIFFSLTFQYIMYVFYSSPGEKKYLEKNIF